MTAPKILTRTDLVTDLMRLGLRRGDLVLCHSSLSVIGRIVGGAEAVVGGLLDVIGSTGTLVVPAFTGEIEEPFTSDMPTAMGAIPNAVLAWPGRQRSSHPQVSVAAIGADAAAICANQPLGYALGRGSPFEKIVQRGGRILLIGVGHNRSSMLHHSESMIDNHRRKVRRFPDVGNDNDTHFLTIGAEFELTDPSVRIGSVGAGEVRLFDAAPYDRFAQARLSDLLETSRDDPGVYQAARRSVRVSAMAGEKPADSMTSARSGFHVSPTAIPSTRAP